jgi:threonine dehydrogenase-like Zn-dependent dehydrogenase
VQLLRMIGAAPIVTVDPLPAARERALALGADLALDPADPDLQARVLAGTGGLAVAFDFAGVPAVREQAVACLAERGKLVLVGLAGAPLTLTHGTRSTYLQQQVLRHYGSQPEHVEELVVLTRRHRIDFSRSISGVLPLGEAVEAVARLHRKEGTPVRLVLRPRPADAAATSPRPPVAR